MTGRVEEHLVGRLGVGAKAWVKALLGGVGLLVEELSADLDVAEPTPRPVLPRRGLGRPVLPLRQAGVAGPARRQERDGRGQIA